MIPRLSNKEQKYRGSILLTRGRLNTQKRHIIVIHSELGRRAGKSQSSSYKVGLQARQTKRDGYSSCSNVTRSTPFSNTKAVSERGAPYYEREQKGSKERKKNVENWKERRQGDRTEHMKRGIHILGDVGKT